VTRGFFWQEKKRWDKMGGLMLRFKDKKGADLCISPTNEETVTDIFRSTVKSYKQLPVTLYQINTKFRDEIRPRFGLMRGREFTMKDAYSFHLDKASLDVGYQALYDAYTAIFTRLGLEFIPVEADGGAMASADSKTHEFQVVANSGEDLIIYSQEAQYAANIEKAQTKRVATSFDMTSIPMKEVETIKTETIDAVGKLLNITAAQSLKSMVYTATTGTEAKMILAMVIGDDSVNEIKLQNYLKCDHLAASSEDELKKAKLWKGYIGPVGLEDQLEIIFDNEINLDATYVIGANKKDAHFMGFNPKRDMKKIVQADLRLSKAGDLTLDGKHSVVEKRGIEVGHVFQLGDKYTKAMKVGVLDQTGKLTTPLMGCYGIGVTRVVAAAIEQNHDANGIIWPKSIAPYDVYFATIVKAEEFVKIADEIYSDMKNAGIDVVYDDRNVGPGNKFKDSDLLGLPYRVVLGERDFGASGELEVIERKTGTVIKVKRDDLISTLKNLLK
jgi:prolyl-tRNA synthetase